VVCFCEHGNEPLGSIEGREFFNQLRILIASQGLCSVESVTQSVCQFKDYLLYLRN
jgi:hypothetical protein